MSRRAIAIIIIGLVLALAAGYGVYSLGMSRGMKMATPPTPAGDSGRKVLYWHDPMVPGPKFDKPGKSPFMDMQLVPKYADEGEEAGGVSISSRMQQNLGVRTALATKGVVAPVVEAVGSVAYNERDVAVVQARASGFIEKLHVRAALDPVRRGQPLADLYVPDWVAAQEEYLAVARMSDASLDALREGAAQRLRLAGMTDDQVRRIVAGDKVQPRITLTAPIDGVVAELTAREGMTIASGAPLFRINGLSTVWVNAQVPESVAAQVRPGITVEARAAALPGRSFKGKVSAILPEVDAATRTLKARVELANPGAQLVPGMFATVDFTPASRREAVMVPTEAVIQTGKRTVVIVADAAQDGKQRFAPVEVEVGAEAKGLTEIRRGIDAGVKVVVSGQFLIDSEASLKATETRLAEGSAGASQTHRGEGKVEAVEGGTVTLSHGPIPTLKWGPMTMDFKLPQGGAPQGVAPGAEVTFDFVQTPGGDYQVTDIRSKGPAPTKAGAR
jgi:membrane fusion protein, copper/silver efflux system